MKKQTVFFSVFMLLLTVSCVDQTPTVYTSISGNWRCEESSVLGSRVYVVEIEKTNKTNVQEYILSNFHNVDINEFVFSTLSGSKLTINPSQSIGSSQINILSGSGDIIGTDFKRINFNYTIFDGQNNIPVTATYTRQ